MPEPRGAYLRCEVKDCPLWRFRAGNPHRYGSSPRNSFEDRSSSVARARAKILEADAEAKLTGKRHMSDTSWWPFGYLDYVAGESARRAIRRHCADCMGGARQVKDCCSPNCPLFPYRLRRRAVNSQAGGIA